MSTVSVEIDVEDLIDKVDLDTVLDRFGYGNVLEHVGIHRVISFLESEIDCLYSGDVSKLKEIVNGKK